MITQLHAAVLGLALFSGDTSAAFIGFDPCLAIQELQEECVTAPKFIVCKVILPLFEWLCNLDPVEPGAINVTFKIVNNSTECAENTLYYQCRWQTKTGEDQSTQTAVGPGGVSTLFIAAYDSDGHNKADFVAFDYSVFDPDPSLGCASGEGSQEDTLQDGDIWTITVNSDGSFSEQVTHAGSSVQPAAKKSSRAPLTPVPDPRFSKK